MVMIPLRSGALRWARKRMRRFRFGNTRRSDVETMRRRTAAVTIAHPHPQRLGISHTQASARVADLRLLTEATPYAASGGDQAMGRRVSDLLFQQDIGGSSTWVAKFPDLRRALLAQSKS